MAVTSRVVNPGRKMIGDRASGVSGAAAAISGMFYDDKATAFVDADTNCNNAAGNNQAVTGGLDSVPTSPAAANPHVVTHLGTITTAQYGSNVVRRVSLHNSATPTSTSATLIAGIDGLALTKDPAFALQTIFKLSYA